jgi:hypothetical protein
MSAPDGTVWWYEQRGRVPRGPPSNLDQITAESLISHINDEARGRRRPDATDPPVRPPLGDHQPDHRRCGSSAMAQGRAGTRVMPSMPGNGRRGVTSVWCGTAGAAMRPTAYVHVRPVRYVEGDARRHRDQQRSGCDAGDHGHQRGRQQRPGAAQSGTPPRTARPTCVQAVACCHSYRPFGRSCASRRTARV